MSLKLWESQAGQKYRLFVAAETQAEANALAQTTTGVNWLKFNSKEVTVPGYILDIRGENDDVRTGKAEDSGLNSPEEPEPAAGTNASTAVEPEQKPEKSAAVNGRGKKAAVRGQIKGRRSR